jgi:uncharacterized protein YutE (UPF0331/DUF86 family)
VGVDKEKIIGLIGEIEKSVTVLKEFSGKQKAAILGDLKALGSIKYYFITAIEACIDICNHITSRERWGVPDSYSECFDLLKENNVLSKEFSKKMVNMAKFRNMLVHLYAKIDDGKVYKFLQSELDSFQKYINRISELYL